MALNNYFRDDDFSLVPKLQLRETGKQFETLVYESVDVSQDAHFFKAAPAFSAE